MKVHNCAMTEWLTFIKVCTEDCGQCSGQWNVRAGYTLSSASLKSKVNRSRYKTELKLALTLKRPLSLPLFGTHGFDLTERSSWFWIRMWPVVISVEEWSVTCDPLWAMSLTPAMSQGHSVLAAGINFNYSWHMGHCIGAMQLASRWDSTWNMQNSAMMNKFAAN